MTDKTFSEEDRTLQQVRRLSDTFLKSGFLSLRVAPGEEKKHFTDGVSLASYVQILSGALKREAGVTTLEGYIVRLIPNGASWGRDVQVSFVPQEDESTRVAVKTPDNTVYLGEDPNFKILLGQVVQSLAEVLR